MHVQPALLSTAAAAAAAAAERLEQCGTAKFNGSAAKS